MKTCKNCIHVAVCCNLNHETIADGCPDFKDRSRFVELPCEIGSDVWWINEETNTVERHEKGVYGILVKSDGVFVMDEAGCLDKIGTKWCYLSKEAAENALKERMMENEIDT